MFKKTLVLLAVLSIFLFGFSCQRRNDEIQEKQAEEEVPEEIFYPELEPEPEKEVIPWEEIEGGHYLPVPHYYQKDVPRYGGYACGPTALKMILEYKKQIGEIKEEVPSISNLIEEAGVKSNVWSNSNVDDFFIEGFGITDVALKKLAQKLDFQDAIIFGKSFCPKFPSSLAIDPAHKGQTLDSKDFKALIDEAGWDMEKLHSIVEEGIPVIVDVTVDLDPIYGPKDPRSYAPFYTEDGQQHWELTFGKGHFMVVIGFQNWGEEEAEVILLDPLKKTGKQDQVSIYSQEAFERSWKLMNNQGLLIR